MTHSASNLLAELRKHSLCESDALGAFLGLDYRQTCVTAIPGIWDHYQAFKAACLSNGVKIKGRSAYGFTYSI